MSNIKINYMILERTIRQLGLYTTLCSEDNEEYGFLDTLFSEAKKGRLPFSNDEVRDIALDRLFELTGVARDYWIGNRRLSLGVNCKSVLVTNFGDQSLKNIDLTNDNGDLYNEVMLNPLDLDYDEIYKVIHGTKQGVDKGALDIQGLYCLDGLIKVFILNMKDEINLYDKTRVFRSTVWEPYVNIRDKPTKEGIIYSPRFIELRKGTVTTIIKNVSNSGFNFLRKDFT